MVEAGSEEDHQLGEEVRISMDGVADCNLSQKEKESSEEDHQLEEARISMDNVDECNFSQEKKESLKQSRRLKELPNFVDRKEQEIKEMLKRKRHQTQSPKIGSVSSIRNNKDLEEYFKPSLIGIGPLQLSFKNEEASDYVKKKMMSQFLEDRGASPEDLYRNIKAELESLITCYEEEKLRQAYESAHINYEDDSLATTFLNDGCAVLQFIYCIANDQLGDLEILTKHQIECLKRGLFLLENQLPYKLLKLLINSRSKKRAEELSQSINKFIDDNVMILIEKKPWQQQEEESAHLLALLRQRMIFRVQSVDKARSFGSTQEKENRPARFLPKIKELNERGIWLSPSKTSISLKDISLHRGVFNCGTATLMLPPIMVDEDTVPKLMNLIAYEMTPVLKKEFGVKSYLSFLHSLTERREDMKELIDAGVVINFLGSNEDVANLFNTIGRNVTPNPRAYSDVKWELKQHFDTAGATIYYWTRKAVIAYFGSPSSFPVLIGLVLTAIQTYYSIPSNKQ